MANKNLPIGGDTAFQKLWVDQGGGSYAEAVAIVSGGGVTTVQGSVADGGAASNPVPAGVLAATNVVKIARGANMASGTNDTGLLGAGMMGFDSANWQRITAQAFHNTDNQSLGGTAYGFLSGGVAQLLNAAGNLDRQRSTGTDGISALGIATGAAQFAMAFSTTCTGNLGSGTQTYTPAAMTGTIAGVTWTIKPGSVLVVDSGGNQETVYVTATTGSTFTALFANAHNGSVTAWTITGFVYNQERDAAGELDGASGSGTAVAAEYEYVSGGPPASGGAGQGFNFDRARAACGKGKASGTISSGGGAASTSITLSAPPANPPQAGSAIQLTGSGTTETVYVSANYASGATIALQKGIVNGTQTTATWDIYAPNGPALNGFLPYGIGIEEESIYNAADGLYYLERSATADALAGANLPAEGLCGWNNVTWDRLRTLQAAAADLQAGKGVLAANPTGQLKSGTITQSDTSAVATDARGSSVTLAQPGGASACGFYVTGNSGNSTLQFEGNIDGTATGWFSINVTGIAAGSVTGSSVTSTSGQWFADIGGLQQVRVRCSTYVSGTPTITLFGTVGTGSASGVRPVFLSSPGGSTVAQQTPSDALSNSNSSIAVIPFNIGFNGTNWDRLRTVQGLTIGGNGLGLLASGGWGLNENDGNWYPLATAGADGRTASRSLLPSLGAYNGSAVDRIRTLQAAAADLQAGKGVLATNIPGLSTTGTIPPSSATSVTLNPVGAATVVGVGITGNGATITYNFEGSFDGTNWFAVNATPLNSHVTTQTASANGNWFLPCSGMLAVRVRNSNGANTGTATITLQAGIGSMAGALDSKGNLLAALVGTDSNSAISTRVPSGDGISQSSDTGLSVFSYLAGLNSSNQWDRLHTASATGVNVGTTGVLANALHGWDGAAYSACKVHTQTDPNLRIQLYDAANKINSIAGSSDGNGWAQQFLTVAAGMYAFDDGASQINRWRNNTDTTVIAAGARTTTQTVNLKNYNGRGIIVTLDITAVGAATTFTLAINNKDGTSGKFQAVLTSAAGLGVATTVYRVYPGLTAVPNVDANGIIARDYQIVVTPSNANSSSYSVGVVTIL
jgi:hypothetical protein